MSYAYVFVAFVTFVTLVKWPSAVSGISV
jgi:hypothetical protein